MAAGSTDATASAIAEYPVVASRVDVPVSISVDRAEARRRPQHGQEFCRGRSVGDVPDDDHEVANQTGGRQPCGDARVRRDRPDELTDERVGLIQRRKRDWLGLAAERARRRLGGRRGDSFRDGSGRRRRQGLTSENDVARGRDRTANRAATIHRLFAVPRGRDFVARFGDGPVRSRSSNSRIVGFLNPPYQTIPYPREQSRVISCRAAREPVRRRRSFTMRKASAGTHRTRCDRPAARSAAPAASRTARWSGRTL